MMLHFRVGHIKGRRGLFREYRSACGWGWELIKLLPM
jgi:hypothetical protein